MSLNYQTLDVSYSSRLEAKASHTVDKSTLHHCAWSHTEPSTMDTQRGFSLMPDVIELWEEAAAPGENPCRHRENMLTPDTERPCGYE